MSEGDFLGICQCVPVKSDPDSSLGTPRAQGPLGIRR